jgi:hypothetical protein
MEEIKELARLYAESKMRENWDRKDEVDIAVFYNHMVDYLLEELRKCQLWGRYEDWKESHFQYDEYFQKYHKRTSFNGSVAPFSSEYTEMDLRGEYIKINNL